MRVGIVGAGSMGHAHAAAWAATDAEVVGIVARHADSAAALAREYGLRAYSGFEELLERVDIVDLCVPTDLHYPMTVQAASAGKHVFCEKPIALTVEDGRKMIDVCAKARVRLFIGHVVRFIPEYRAAQEVVASGQIGKPGVIRLTRASYQPRKATDNWFVDESRSGGMILDLMIHDYDYARWIAGDVIRVYAKSVRAIRRDAPGDYALVTLRFANGAIGHIEGGWAYPPGIFRRSIDIAGTDGVIEWNSDTTETLHMHLAEAPKQEAAEVGLPLALGDNPFVLEIRHFYEAVVHDEPFSVTPQDALAALQIGLAAREALKTGRSVNLAAEVG